MPKANRSLLALTFLVAVLIGHGAVKAETNSLPVRREWYTGVIGANSHVLVELHIPVIDWSGKQKVTGSYYDVTAGQPFQLVGSTDGVEWNLQVRDASGRCTGNFAGQFDPNDGNVSLTWSNSDGIQKLPVTLNRIAQETSLCFTQGPNVTISYRRPQFLSNWRLAKLVENQLRNDSAKDFASESKYPADSWPKPLDYADLYRDEDDVNIDIAYFSESLISLRVHTYYDGGGAHGSEFLESRNFLLREGKLHELKLRDLFRPGGDYLSLLSNDCLRALREKQASFVLDGTVKTLGAKDLRAFVLGPRGITFMFSPYMVASFAEGAFEVTIPWKMLSDIVVLDAPLGHWVAAQNSHGDETNAIPSVTQYDNDL
jgi:hypothetical protein